MRIFQTPVSRVIAVSTMVALVSLCWYFRPWEREVWVTTTPEAFVTPAITSLPGARPGVMVVGITPEPWPKEAGNILRAARRGRMHVTLISKNAVDRFDVIGVTREENLVVDTKSMTDQNRVVHLLFDGKRRTQ
jgi:hypothetical protein